MPDRCASLSLETVSARVTPYDTPTMTKTLKA